jgi:uncharacterized membrane protein
MIEKQETNLVAKNISNSNGIANRLRKRESVETKLSAPKNQQMRLTRSMAKDKITNGVPSKTTVASSNANKKKRDTKSMEKDMSSVAESELEDMKVKYSEKYSKREKYFNQGNAIYQEYDEFLKKKKKDRKIEFIKLKKEPNEEFINSTNSKDLLKFFGGPNSDQDTF